jgi:signal peptidase I
VAVLKSFVGDVYRIDSGSMRPTLFDDGDGGTRERVLVRYARAPELERFDLAVLGGRNGGDALVKRIAGLPGETIQIAGGDLLVDGHRLAVDAPRPAPITVFDDRRLAVDEFFHYERERGTWTQDAQGWRLEAGSIALGSDEGMLLYHPELLDSYLDRVNRFVRGHLEVNDGIVECEVRADEVAGALRLQLSEEGDTFRALIEPEGPDARAWRARLTRHNPQTLARPEPGARIEELSSAAVAFVLGEWHRLSFSNIDNVLVFELEGPAGRSVLAVPYASNVAHGRAGAAGRHVGARAGLGGEAARATFRSIRVLRDLYFTDNGMHAIDAPLPLGPDELFLLGDNSAQSSDSRTFGPVRREEITGVPVWVVWPLEALRPLAGARAR